MRSIVQILLFSLVLTSTLCAIVQSVPDQNNSFQVPDKSTSVAGNDSNSTRAAINSSLMVNGRWERISDLPRQINSFAVDPVDPSIIYAGAGLQGSGSGVYKSEDAGLTWSLTSKGLPSVDVNSLVIDPLPPYRLYASLMVSGYTNIYSSSDGAQSWTLLSKTGIFGGLSEQLFSDPGNGDALFLIAPPRGLFRSIDGGRNWLPVNEGLPQNPDFENGAYVLSIAVDSNSSKTIYAGTGYISGQGHGVFKSVDGGQTWAPANKGMIDYRISAMAIDPTNTQIIYAGSDKGELFKSSDGGQTWVDMSDRDLMDQYSSPEVKSITLDPSDPKTVYVLANEAGFLVSYDAASSWLKLGRPESLDDYARFTASTVAFEPQPVLILGVDPYVKNAGGWRFAAS